MISSPHISALSQLREDRLKRAGQLEAEAVALRVRAHHERPLPDFWRKGQKIRYITTQEWAWSKGNIAYVHGLHDEYKDRKFSAGDYQVFYTGPKGKSHPSYWTTPDDVELVEDVPSEPESPKPVRDVLYVGTGKATSCPYCWGKKTPCGRPDCTDR